MKFVYFLVICVWCNETWWRIELSTLNNLNDERRVIEDNVINCLIVVLMMVSKACWIIIDGVSWFYCCVLCNVMKMVIFSLLCEHVICIVSRDVSCATMDTIFRGMCCSLRWIIYFDGRMTCHDCYYYWVSFRAFWWMHRLICPPWVPYWESTSVYF